MCVCMCVCVRRFYFKMNQILHLLIVKTFLCFRCFAFLFFWFEKEEEEDYHSKLNKIEFGLDEMKSKLLLVVGW